MDLGSFYSKGRKGDVQHRNEGLNSGMRVSQETERINQKGADRRESWPRAHLGENLREADGGAAAPHQPAFTAFHGLG